MTKLAQYADEPEDTGLVRVFKALGHAKRFRMIQEIAAAGELSCGELAEKFKLSQPTISHHLKILLDARLVAVRNERQHHFLSVDAALLDEVAALLPARLTKRRRTKRKKTR